MQVWRTTFHRLKKIIVRQMTAKRIFPRLGCEFIHSSSVFPLAYQGME